MLTNLKQWKKIILSLPDEEFFDIMRNYLGELKTPFNKHLLIEQLLAFLSKEETVERIISLVNDADAYLLTLIYSLGGPTTKVLFGFVQDSQSFLEYQNHLLNLEERLLIYKEPDTGKIRLSPIFKGILEERILDTRLVFPSKKITTKTSSPPWFSEALLIALISFLKNSPDLFKLDGELKKRSLDELSSVFPLLFNGSSQESRFEFLFKVLQKLHLLIEKEGKVHIHFENVHNVSKLPILNRYTLFFAAASTNSKNMKDISKRAEILSYFISSIPEGRGFSFSTLLSFLRFYSRSEKIDENELQKTINVLITTEILHSHGKDIFELNHFFSDILYNSYDEPAFIIQPSFIITTKPWITLDTGIPLALSSDILKYDIFAEYEITKQSCIKIRQIGMAHQDLLAYLDSMSGNSTPQNIKTSLEHWALDYNTFQLFEGVTLVVSSPRRVVIDHLETLKPFIKSNPAPGVYIFNKEDEKEWSKLLNEAGLPVLSRADSAAEMETETIHFEEYPQKGSHLQKITFIEREQLPDRDSPVFINELKKVMDSRKFSRTEHEDILARIERKLILFPGQLQRALKSKDKAEVGGLDYTGKVRLIQRALDSKRTILEIKSTALPEKNNRILIKPLSVNHDGPNLILFAQTLPEENDIEIPIRKISYVKLLRSSLYAPVSG